MRVEEVKEQLRQCGKLDAYREFLVSSATVELAAAAIGCEPGRIAKTLSFTLSTGPIVVVAMGEARVDNQKFKAHFKEKARFPKGEEVEQLTGHPVGGVCPFALNSDVQIFLDESLKVYDPVYPAAGASNNAVCLSLEDLQAITGGQWIDVCSVPTEVA